MWRRWFPCMSLALRYNVEQLVRLCVSGTEMKFGSARSPVFLWASAAIWMSPFYCISLALRCNVESHVPLFFYGSEL
jgi:hypothetical protein